MINVAEFYARGAPVVPYNIVCVRGKSVVEEK